MISVENYTTHTLVIKKSEFICHLIPCSQIEQAKQLIEKYSDPQATHNCVAYIIGTHERAYDDGEPSGTAGMQIKLPYLKNTHKKLLLLLQHV